MGENFPVGGDMCVAPQQSLLEGFSRDPHTVRAAISDRCDIREIRASMAQMGYSRVGECPDFFLHDELARQIGEGSLILAQASEHSGSTVAIADEVESAMNQAQEAPPWTLSKFIRWQFEHRVYGSNKTLTSYKDAWVLFHARTIRNAAQSAGIPTLLLAGTCWIEVGGDPTFVDTIAFGVRAFDHLGDPLLKPLTITKEPQLTSVGDVSIQLRRAAETLGLNPGTMSISQQSRLKASLDGDVYNISIVARHLAQLAAIDNLPKNTDDYIRVVGARYNRGPHLSLEAIRKNTSYGDAILKRRAHLEALLR